MFEEVVANYLKECTYNKSDQPLESKEDKVYTILIQGRFRKYSGEGMAVNN
jgi:hypothetical protein